ncbi:hypothetical protein [Paenibacillus amylolyticus]|uniref:hypothetical protein n=1 Tax=Paenibacillus amylolyticus TaxID=1451 RepID=UPI00201DF2F5|nr:hypothetical protein [Paenibacillus amylolyticus]MCL6663526.1 hypothetical protein [Paenibacillus amylolyticus]
MSKKIVLMVIIGISLVIILPIYKMIEALLFLLSTDPKKRVDWALEPGAWTDLCGILVSYIGVVVTGYFSWLLYKVSSKSYIVSQKAVEVSEKNIKLTEHTSKMLAVIEKRNVEEKINRDAQIKEKVSKELQGELFKVRSFTGLLKLQVQKYLDEFTEKTNEVRHLNRHLNEQLDNLNEEIKRDREEKRFSDSSVKAIELTHEFYTKAKIILDGIVDIESPRLNYLGDLYYDNYYVDIDLLNFGIAFKEVEINIITEIVKMRNDFFSLELIRFDDKAIGFKKPERMEELNNPSFDEKWNKAKELLEFHTEKYEKDIQNLYSRLSTLDDKLQELLTSFNGVSILHEQLSIFDNLINVNLD